MTCGLITLFVTLLGAPFVLGLGWILGAQVAEPAPPIRPTPTLVAAMDAEIMLNYRVALPPDTFAFADVQASASVIERRLDTLGIPYVGAVSYEPDRIRVGMNRDAPVDELAEMLTRPGVFELIEMHQLGDHALSLLNETVDTERYPDRGGFRNARTDAPFAVIVGSEHIDRAEVSYDSATGRSLVTVYFNEAGAERMRAYTSQHTGVPIGIVVDGVLELAPVIQGQVSDQAVINMTEDDAAARRLAALIGSGALPVPLILDKVEASEG